MLDWWTHQLISDFTLTYTWRSPVSHWRLIPSAPVPSSQWLPYQTLKSTLFWFCDNLKEMIIHFVPSSADIPNLCVSFRQFFMCNSSLIMLFYIVSSCPAVEFVLLKTLNRLRTFLSLLLVSYMKPNQYSTMLDWKLEAVSTRIYWFLPFSSLPSILTAQTLQLRLGFIHHRGCSCTRPHWAPLWEEEKAWYIHWPYLICASDYL